MSSGAKKKYVHLNTASVSLGCGSSCRRPRLMSAFFSPKPSRQCGRYASNNHGLRHHQHRTHHSSSSSSWDTTTTTLSSDADADIKSLMAVQGFGRIGGESVAVEKDSNDPYLDFRQSMLQMILEKEIYAADDLKQLLNCFLKLNSPYYHGTIVRAFTEIWNGVYPSSAAACPRGHGYGTWMPREF